MNELVLKSDDNDYESLSMEVIDITSEWASKLKETTVNFAKVSNFFVDIEIRKLTMLIIIGRVFKEIGVRRRCDKRVQGSNSRVSMQSYYSEMDYF